MPIEAFGAFAATMLAISLAAERVVSIAKTSFPWLGAKKQAGAEAARRIAVQAIAFAAGWVTAAFLTNSASGFDMFGSVGISGSQTLPAVVVGFLAGGGSALWSNVIGYTKAVKDIQKNTLPEDMRGPN